jgi:hypothetical protein
MPEDNLHPSSMTPEDFLELSRISPENLTKNELFIQQLYSVHKGKIDDVIIFYNKHLQADLMIQKRDEERRTLRYKIRSILNEIYNYLYTQWQTTNSVQNLCLILLLLIILWR